MKKRLILCYSKTGNSKFIAEKLTQELNCELDFITPSFNKTGLLFLISLLQIPVSVDVSNDRIKSFDEIVLVGPVWGGLLVAPLKAVLKKCIRLSKPVHFAVTCESPENEKDGQFGFNNVFKKVKTLGGSLVKNTAAFSTSLTTGYEGKIHTDLNSKASITEENFSIELKNRLDEFKQRILAS